MSKKFLSDYYVLRPRFCVRTSRELVPQQTKVSVVPLSVLDDSDGQVAPSLDHRPEGVPSVRGRPGTRDRD